MLKSKIFRYCAISVAVVATAGFLLSNNTFWQNQTQAQNQVQSKLSGSDALAEIPTPDKFLARSEGANMPSGKMLKQLNLSAEQLLKLKTIRDRDPDKIRELGQQARQADKELRDLLASNESVDVIRAKHLNALNLRQELSKQHFERLLAMREVLTPQQRLQLNELMQKNRPNKAKDGFQNRMEERLEKRGNLQNRQSL